MPVSDKSKRSETRTESVQSSDGRRRQNSPVSRRRFLNLAQVTGASVGLGALAGCTGGDGGDGSDGGGGPTTAPGTSTSGSGSGSGDLETVRFSFVPSAATAPIWLADEHGYFEERGIQIEGTTSVSGSQATAQLGTGQLDISVGAVGASTFNAIADDVPVKFSADEASATPGLPIGNRYWIRDGLYTEGMTFDDVEPPVTIATNAGASVGDYMLGRTIAIHDNLSWDNIDVELLPFPQMVSAMESEAIDIAQQIDPLGPVMEENIDAHHLEYSNRPTPNLHVSGIIVGGPFINERRDVARKWHEAYVLGIRKFYELGGLPSDDVAPLVAQRLDSPESSLRISIPYLPNKNGYLNEDDVVAQQEYHACQGYVDSPVPREEIFATDLLEEALDEIGRVPESEERVSEDVFNEMREASPADWPPLSDHRTPEEWPSDEICGNPIN